ncbi:MAG TPA: hypothetical protein VLS93_00235 [Anaeromyxobacteraceae bacterium]|nr:hypothetical protein [Anaeromyxobacteraceae bacterium]
MAARAAFAAALIALAGPTPAQDEAAREEPAPEAPPPPPRPGTPIDAGHAALERLLDRVLALDRFFAEDGDLDPQRRRSWVAWRNQVRLTSAHDPEVRTALRASLRFPGLERWLHDRLRVVVEGVSSDAETLLPDGQPPPPGEPRLGQDAAALLRYAFIDRLGLELGASAGVLLRLPPDAVVRLRARWAVPAGDLFLVRLALVPFWRSDLRLGATASADVQRELGRAALARLGGSATANQEERARGLQWSAELALLRSLGPGSAASLGYGVGGVTRPRARVESHRVYLRARRSLLRPWLFAEVEPEAVWPLTDPAVRRPVLGVYLRLEMQVHGDGPWETAGP